MKCYSNEFKVPDVRPFDVQETWFESFVGSVYAPVIASGLLGRFWFTGYGAVGVGKTALFRFETDQIARVMEQIRELVAQYGVTHSGHSDYDIAGDTGHG